MTLINKLINNLCLELAVIILVLFFQINGWSAWLEGVYLGLGLLLGWFLISAHLNLIKTPQLSLIFASAVFQTAFLLFSFWLVISNESLVASGIVLGVNLFFIKDLVFDYQKRRLILKKKLFNNIDIYDRFVSAYLIGFILIVALLTVLVIS